MRGLITIKRCDCCKQPLLQGATVLTCPPCFQNLQMPHAGNQFAVCGLHGQRVPWNNEARR